MFGALPKLPLILPVLLTAVRASVVRVATLSSRSSCACSEISSDTLLAWMAADVFSSASLSSLCVG